MRLQIVVIAAWMLCSAASSFGSDFLRDPNLVMALKIKDISSENADKQVAITDVPDSIKNGKCAVFNGPSSLDFTRSGKIKLTEGSLLLWVYIPPEPAKRFQAGEQNSWLAILGSDLQKNRHKPGLNYVAASLAVPNKDLNQIELWSNIRGEGTISGFPVVQGRFLKGWQQVAICFSGAYAASYLDGVLTTLLAQEKTKNLFLPLSPDCLFLHNGSVEEKGMDIGMVGIARVVLTDRCLSSDEVREYRKTDKLPAGAKTPWTIDFSKGKPGKSCGDLKIDGRVDFKEIK